MTQEDKDLLLKDLSARLPYGVKVKTPYNDAILRGIVDRKGVKTIIDYTDIVTDKQTYPIRYIQPYLRPMSSMTEEEKHQWIGVLKDPEYSCSGDDWLIEHHFDIRHLIDKELAIEVTKDNNPYKD